MLAMTMAGAVGSVVEAFYHSKVRPMANYRCIVMTNPVPGREDEYNDWYDNRHLDDVLSIPGFVRAQRFECAVPLSAEPPKFRYLSIYEIESDDIAATIELLVATAGTNSMKMSEAMDMNASAIVYRARGPAKEATAVRAPPATIFGVDADLGTN